MKLILKTLNNDITLKKGMFYSVIEFFFSGITPSSTGGQPVQLYYMTKDKIPMRKSYITLILNTIYFKLVLLVLGIITLFLHNSYIMNSKPIYQIFFGIGFLIDLILIIIGFVMLFKEKFIKKVFLKIFSFLKKIKLFHRKIEHININEVMEMYSEEITFIKTHVKTVVITFIITLIQRLILFSIIYVIYLAIGTKYYSYFNLLAIQVSVQIAMEALPLPGGSGLSERMLHSIFVSVFTIELADVGMLLTRTFTFYIPLIVSGLIILGEYIYRKKHIFKRKTKQKA